MTRTTIIFSLKLLVSVTIFAVLVSKFEFSQISARFTTISQGYVLLALCTCLVLNINNTLRWRSILRAIKRPLPFGFTFRAQYIGGFFNQALPSVIGGDAVRIYLSQKAGISLQKSINSVVIERMVSLSALIYIVTALQPFVPGLDKTGYAQYVFPALSVAATAGVITVMILDRLPIWFQRSRVFDAFSNIAFDTKSVFLSPVHLFVSMSFGISGIVLMTMIAFLCAMSLGITVSVIDALVFIPPAILVSTLPISIAGWGVREGAMVTTLAYAGVAEVDAIVISIVFGLALAATSLPGGVFWLLGRQQENSNAQPDDRFPE